MASPQVKVQSRCHGLRLATDDVIVPFQNSQTTNSNSEHFQLAPYADTSTRCQSLLTNKQIINGNYSTKVPVLAIIRPTYHLYITQGLPESKESLYEVSGVFQLDGTQDVNIWRVGRQMRSSAAAVRTTASTAAAFKSQSDPTDRQAGTTAQAAAPARVRCRPSDSERPPPLNCMATIHKVAWPTSVRPSIPGQLCVVKRQEYLNVTQHSR